MLTPLIELVCEELAKNGLLKESANSNSEEAQTILRGWRDYDSLAREVQSDLRPFQRFVVQSFVTGTMLTEFAVASVGISEVHLRTVGSLGGLVLMIVSAFDMLLDSSGLRVDLFSGAGTKVQAEDHRVVMLRELVRVYFKRLDQLPQRKSVRRLVDKSIRQMYAAEIQSAVVAPVSRQVWWRKNVLPFIVMAMPVWLVADSFHEVSFRRHLRWLANFGEFLGWLDDCADYEEDLRSGSANRIQGQLELRSDRSLARWIAAQGMRVMVQWDATSTTPQARVVLPVVVWSWIKKIPRHTPQ